MSSNQKLPVDLELKKAFQELQMKMLSTSQQLKVSDLQIEQLKNQITRTKLVGKELEALPENVNTYRSLGRMFLKTPLQIVHQYLDKETSGFQDKIKSIENTKHYLERTLKESEENLRELVLSKQREQT
ncbi:hypothetical protein HELRODRAFT_62144 [Helobdella robusta]|uniref:Prefoldin subunit 1 n=1 Tax=Helobdella robusta TaxID=6412 RepID=T1FWW2_HELRO|nr:hypothetical protein HELRODRAFT_62144 [Helobdella robusta]ESO12041.1 hypothetical protein HELRODRAFT_62144 [Helobdella robusta]